MIIKHKEIEGVIFDLDGTLADSMWVWKALDVEFLSRFDKKLPDDLQNGIEGMSFTETAEFFKKRFSLPLTVDEIKNTWNDMAYEKYSREVGLKPGVHEFLRYLKDNNIKMAIASSNSETLIDAVLKVHDIGHYFSAVVTSCQVKAGKPAPDVYLRAAEEIETAPEKCAVFEDIPAGIQAGKAAGMMVFAVEDEYSDKLKDIKLKMADGYIKDYRELIG